MTDITVTILENIRADIAVLKEQFEGRFDALDGRIDATNERIDRTNDQLESLVNIIGLLARNHGSVEQRVEALERASKG